MRRIISCYFAGPGTRERWPRMARVFEYSARTHCPKWQLSHELLRQHRYKLNESQNHASNTLKLEHWCDAIANADDGDEVLLIDADTFILRALDDVWSTPFDVAYTVRPPDYPMPLNGGVVFVRVSSSTRKFMELWREANRLMKRDRALQARWRRYQGCNQRALGMLLEESRHGLGVLRQLPCAEWNCEDSAWPSFDPQTTRIVHVKSALRDAVCPSQYSRPPKPHLAAIARIWHELEASALIEAANAK